MSQFLSFSSGLNRILYGIFRKISSNGYENLKNRDIQSQFYLVAKINF